MDAAPSDGGRARSGRVGGRACGRVRFALPEDWRRDALVGWGGLHQRCCRGRDEGASDAHKAYVRSHGKDAGWVANVMAQEGMGNGIQPG